MAHTRKQIRDAMTAALTGLVTTGANVFSGRVHPFHNEGAELPGLCLYTTAEEIANDEEDTVSHIQSRECLFVVEGYVSAADPAALEDTLDTIASEVEVALFADQFLGGISQGIDLVGTDQDFNAEGNDPLGVIMMIFKVIYLTGEGSPDTPL